MIPHCALCGCDCTDDDYCSGCMRYVCDAHPEHAHGPEAHDGEEGDEA